MEEEKEETRGVCVPRGFSQSSTAIDTVGLFVRRRKVFTLLTSEICNSESVRLENNILKEKLSSLETSPIAIFSLDPK